MSQLPGRNDLCHCGSGSKYKKCCIEKDAAARAETAAILAAAEPAASAPLPPRAPRAKQQAPRPEAASRTIPSSARRRSV